MFTKKPPIIHPLLFCLFPLLYLYAYNISQIYFGQVLVIVLVILGLTLIFQLCLGFILKNKQKTGIMISFSLWLFFSYGHFYRLYLTIGGLEISRHRYLLPLWTILFIIGSFWVIKTQKKFYRLTNFLNIFAASLIFINLVNIGIYIVKIKSISSQLAKSEKKESSPWGLIELDYQPDIYYIILDGYARNDVLKEVFNYDNGKFTDYLTNRGFYIASRSRSNYVCTDLSLASSLNMKYLNYLSDELGSQSEDKIILYEMVRQNKVIHFLKSKGYRILHFNSVLGATTYNPYADINIGLRYSTDYIKILIRTTFLFPFLEHLPNIFDRKAILYAFDKLAEVPRIRTPTFAFVHLMLPRDPIIFDENGKPVNPRLKETIAPWNDKKGYINQLIFLNKKLKGLIDRILSDSLNPPLIILQADHGSRATWQNWDLNDQEITKLKLRERTSIFNAYYLPMNGRYLLYESISPVNTFRIILNLYFGINCPLLEDKNYFSSYPKLYNFILMNEEYKLN